MTPSKSVAGYRRVLIASTVATTIKSFLMGQADALRDAGFIVDVAASSDGAPPNSTSHLNVLEVPFSRRPQDVRHHLRAIVHLRRLLTTRRYSLVYVHTPIASALVRLAVMLLPPSGRPRVVYFAHGFHFLSPADRGFSQWVWYVIERTLSRVTTLMIVINTMDWNSTSSWAIAERGGVRYLPGIGIDAAYFHPGKVEPVNVAEYGGSSDISHWVGCVAEFSRNKRHPLLLEALSALPEQVGLVLVGDDAEATDLKAFIRRRGLVTRVVFTGYLSDVRPIYRSLSATVLVSVREGLPRSLMESLCMGTPIAVTNMRGGSDLARATGCPIAADATPEGVAVAIQEALADPRDCMAVRNSFLQAWRDGLEPKVTRRIVSMLEEVHP